MAAGEGSGGARAILEIPIDDADWQAFLKSFHEYNALLSKQGDAWASTNSGIKQMGTAFEEAEESFDGLAEKATSNKFSGSSGAFVKVTKSSKETEKSWRNIARDLEKSSKSMVGLARNGLSFAGVGGLLGLGGVAAAGVGIFDSVRGADNSLANQNLLNRKLDLRPGEEQAFNTEYGKAGGDTALLSKIAAAKADPTQWRYLQAAGVSQQDIQSKGTEALSEEFLQKVGGMVRKLGPQQFGMWAHSQGVDQFGDTNQLRLAGSYSDADYAGMHQRVQALTPQLAAQQKDYDAATAAKAALDAALAKDTLELDKALIKLNPLIVEAAQDVTAWITAFAKSEDFGKDVQDIETAFDELAKAGDWLADKFNSWFGNNDKDPKKESTVSLDKNGLGANLVALAKHPWDYLSGKDRSAPGFEWNYGDAAHKTVSGSSNTPTEDRYLDATKFVESHGKADAVGPVTKEGWQALGAYQMSPANLQKQGVVNPFDEHEERRAAERMRSELLKKYNGNEHEVEAAYNWGEGSVDKFLKAHGGQWTEEGLPPGVLDYLHQMDAAVASGGPLPEPATAQKTAKGTAEQPKILPMDSVDRKAIAAREKANQDAVSESFLDRMKRAAGVFSDAVSAGGGSALRGDDSTSKRIDRQGNTQMAPYNVHVTVTSPAGSNTTVTAGTLAQ